MDVSRAVQRRTSVRAFRTDPVSREIIEEILHGAARAASGGNLQPWKVHVLTGEALARTVGVVAAIGPDPVANYKIYPDDLWEPYRSRRFDSGEQLYATLGIGRDDRVGRLRQLNRNLTFFDAPVGLFVFIERRMGSAQWIDLGMYIQTVMLLALERGLDTCAQEFWSMYGAAVAQALSVPDEFMLVCGVALGHRDSAAPVNDLVTTRADPAEWLSLHGFDP